MVKTVVALMLVTLLISFHSWAKFTVVTELSPPNQTWVNDQVAGISTELVKAILDTAELEGDFYMYPWARALSTAKDKPNTLIYSMAKTPQREALFHWIGPVALFNLGFVTNQPPQKVHIESLTDAKQYRLAVQREDVAAQVLQTLGFEFIETADIQQSYHLLAANKVDLVVDDPRYVSAIEQAMNLPDNHFRYVLDIEPLSVRGYLAVSLATDPELVVRLRTAYQQLIDTPLYRKALFE
ncbi:amino acid ABC transporter substrate-binding protein [Pseudoalteromonas rubra]|uniref:Amino acid ABC transporter substrate-binding protein n=1 Tax=Pseudoalteromonas rubra TaxID=43658 RepID=A0A5S3WI86_9GAMM|nr:transporter substrate-binding domain-containing protein [Pseudoalteromonas rubra]TMP26816.1 amino acid ABC transporter substrate-binding protein [Pseudoalteromonas rubra]TMP33799.1 amino acid ABC transporter substrate-binding protein [Pseudoalteromonas rubra]